MQLMNRRWMLLTGLGGLLTIMLGMSLVWLNIERMDLAYDLKRLNSQAKELDDHAAKLRVERDNLLAPYRIKKLAENYGLHVPKAGQVRRAGAGHGQK